MFFSPIDDGWGGILYIPTQRGEALLTVVIALSLLLAMVFIQLTGENVSARKLAFCTFAIGLSALLSSVSIFTFPTGGTITLLSMLIMALPGYWYGLGAGVMTGIAYGLFQIIIDPYIISVPQAIVDYILAFGVIGLSGVMRHKKFGIIKGYLLGVFGRYIFATISGWIFFGMYAWEGWRPLSYSLCYNAIYIFAEAALTCVILAIPQVRRLLDIIREYANKIYFRQEIVEE